MLEGDLGDFTLPDVLRLLSFTSKSGRLELGRPGEQGHVELSGGRVVQAWRPVDGLGVVRRLVERGLVDAQVLRRALDAGGDEPDDPAVLEALVAEGGVAHDQLEEARREHTLGVLVELGRWREGAFRFAPGTPDQPAEAGVAVDELLEAVQRRLDALAVLDGLGPPPAPAPSGRGSVAMHPVPDEPDPGAVPAAPADVPAASEHVPAAPEEVPEAPAAVPAAPEPERAAAASEGSDPRPVAPTGASAEARPEPPAPSAAEGRGGRRARLRQDPGIDEDLVNRLITGIREL